MRKLQDKFKKFWLQFIGVRSSVLKFSLLTEMNKRSRGLDVLLGQLSDWNKIGTIIWALGASI